MKLVTLLERIDAFLAEDYVDMTTEQLTDALERRGDFVEGILDSNVEEYAKVPRWSYCSKDVRAYYRRLAYDGERRCETRDACRKVDKDLRFLRTIVTRDLRIQRLFEQMAIATPRELLLLACSEVMLPRFWIPREGFADEIALRRAWAEARRRFADEVVDPLAKLTL